MSSPPGNLPSADALPPVGRTPARALLNRRNNTMKKMECVDKESCSLYDRKHVSFLLHGFRCIGTSECAVNARHCGCTGVSGVSLVPDLPHISQSLVSGISPMK